MIKIILLLINIKKNLLKLLKNLLDSFDMILAQVYNINQDVVDKITKISSFLAKILLI